MFPWETELFNEYNGERWDDNKKQLVSVDDKKYVYYIFNKDRLLAEFEWVGMFESDKYPELIKDYGLPKFISSNFDSWVASRTPPKNREYMYKVLERLKLTSIKGIIDFSYGLSLNDTLFITKDKSIKWEDINLYDNEFDEVISKIAFDGGLHGFPTKEVSPEFSTGGMLPKCWVRRGNKILLKKG